MNTTMLKGMAIAFVLIGTMTVYSAWRLTRPELPGSSEGEPYVQRPPGYDAEVLTRWTVPDSNNNPFRSEDLEGQVYVASFFFATCPGTCTLQNTHLRTIADQYGPKGVRFLSFTTDPKVDTPAKLREYAVKFKANAQYWHFLRTSDLEYLQRIGTEIYRMPVGEQMHMDRFVLVDKWGNLRMFCDWKGEEQRSALLAKMDQLLAEEAPPEHLQDPTETPPVRPPGYEDLLQEEAEEAAAAQADRESDGAGVNSNAGQESDDQDEEDGETTRSPSTDSGANDSDSEKKVVEETDHESDGTPAPDTGTAAPPQEALGV